MMDYYYQEIHNILSLREETMIVDFILMSISVIISIFAIIYVSLYHENFASKLNALLIILIYLFVGIIYFISFSLSTITYYNKDTALILWKHSILIRILAMGLLISIHSFIIDYHKTKFIYGFIFSFLGGIISSLSFFSNSFEIIKFGENYIILIQNPYLLIFIMLFDMVLVILTCFMQMRSYSKIQNKEFSHQVWAILPPPSPSPRRPDCNCS